MVCECIISTSFYYGGIVGRFKQRNHFEFHDYLLLKCRMKGDAVRLTIHHLR
jgi:hypothetical protein